MVVRMRHTRAHTANRRSHHKIDAPILTLCKECGSPKKPHAICEVCGKYKGREIINVTAKIAKKEKKIKEKEKELSK
ncbi:MAG: 50S ribosomal protein L32 [Candidatus Zambryskibacteria bacterium]|nr:50S ribosomal protein L32 [Candidatus Zambryskibacteria bacterium]